MEQSYWPRLAQGRWNRRRFLVSVGATGVGAAGLALVGCGDDDDDDDDTDATSTGTAASTGTTAVTSTATEAATDEATEEATGEAAEEATEAAASEAKRGGAAVFNAALDTVDSFDAHRARFGPIHALLAPAMSRIVEYKDPDGFELGGDLAASWEQPDDVTTIFQLKPDIFWHDKPPVNGRAFTTEDIVFDVERQQAGLDRDGVEDLNFYRKTAMNQILNVDTPDESTFTFNMDGPDGTFFDVLAGPWAFIMSREAVETFSNEEWLSFDPKTVVGTGPFVMESFELAERAEFSANPLYYDGGIPYMDGMVQLNTFGDPATGEAAFRQKQIDDWQSPAKATTDGVVGDNPELVLTETGFGNPVVGTYATTVPPWNDVRLMQAINLVYDRQQLITQLHSGLGRPSANVLWVLGAWALPQEELTSLPGYRTEKDEDYATARELWQAAGGPDSLTLILPDIFASSFSAAAEAVPAQLSEGLGIPVTSEIRTYVQISQGLADKSLSFWFGWGNTFDTPDPRAALFRYFHSTGSENQWGTNQPGGVVVDGLDDDLAAAKTELDLDAAKEIILDVQRKLIEVGGAGIQIYYNYIAQVLTWPYLKGLRPSAVYFWQDRKNFWLDQDDPSFQGRFSG